MNMKQLNVGMAVLVAAVFSFGCQRMEGTTPNQATSMESPQAASEGTASAAPSPQVAVAVIGISDADFSVEIAETDDQKAKGLSARESLPENAGMWFVFAQPGNEKFWMKDTTIPLDLIFVDENMKVAHVIANAVPGSLELLTSPTPYQYVLEVNAGAAAKHTIKIGDEVKKKIGK
jgi:uncharacterized membrane protein (UPF0127 family)